MIDFSKQYLCKTMDQAKEFLSTASSEEFLWASGSLLFESSNLEDIERTIENGGFVVFLTYNKNGVDNKPYKMIKYATKTVPSIEIIPWESLPSITIDQVKL